MPNIQKLSPLFWCAAPTLHKPPPRSRWASGCPRSSDTAGLIRTTGPGSPYLRHTARCFRVTTTLDMSRRDWARPAGGSHHRRACSHVGERNGQPHGASLDVLDSLYCRTMGSSRGLSRFARECEHDALSRSRQPSATGEISQGARRSEIIWAVDVIEKLAFDISGTHLLQTTRRRDMCALSRRNAKCVRPPQEQRRKYPAILKWARGHPVSTRGRCRTGLRRPI